MELFGHEALTRGPARHGRSRAPSCSSSSRASTRRPGSSSSSASSSSAVALRAPSPGGNLFINVEADSITALAREGPQTIAPLFALKHPVVLEVTERSAIRDIPVFREALARLREQGLPDRDRRRRAPATPRCSRSPSCGPNFLKVANTLITGLHSDTIKRDVVEMLVNLARRIDAICVAEGIETPEDLEECRRLGIPYGQGFYLGVPEERPAEAPAREFTGRVRTSR